MSPLGQGWWHSRLCGLWRHQARLAADDGVLGERIGGQGKDMIQAGCVYIYLIIYIYIVIYIYMYGVYCTHTHIYIYIHTQFGAPYLAT